MARRLLLFAIVALLLGVALGQTCDIEGKWTFTLSYEGAYGSEEGTSTVDFKSDGSYTVDADADADTDELSCEYSYSEEGTYNITSSDEMTLTPSSCEFTNCSDDCADVCSGTCSVASPSSTTVVFDSSCDSFHLDGQDGIVYEKDNSWGWLLWALVIAVVVIAIAIVVVAVVAGFVLWKKKQTSANIYEEA